MQSGRQLRISLDYSHRCNQLYLLRDGGVVRRLSLIIVKTSIVCKHLRQCEGEKVDAAPYLK